ncbi:MAG: GNAT family N-acetyltransferase [Limosilactobacillus gorillae]|jgi:L-amino acid N-acyltransferase YncA|uniref:GNAT family N-acetyltransferase n=1 Tax=Limosilactobacillus gorillae TaxID=1450649 RepID=UPI000A7ED32F|nr:GNAT family N-acetyltransferase [Limosilactobacillus gorillae]MDO4855869.1 GNAT family N-acetyltransferase [Limosilactobacillus gorillae]
MITFQRATKADLPVIVAIYNQAIASHTVTADISPVTIEERQAWLDSFNDQYPLWVAKDDNRVIGWVGLKPFYGLAAYRHTAEVTIYFDQVVRHQGIGTRALNFLEGQIKDHGITALVAYIFGENQASQALFKKFSFQKWGLFPRVATFPDRTQDLVIYGKRYD